MIISLSGRKKSGKSELSKVLVKDYGFEVLHFADALKNMMCHILKIDRIEYELIKESKIMYMFTDDDLIYISKITNIDINLVIQLLHNKYVETTRDMAQLLGTELIRGYNPDWHIEQLKKQIKPNKNYCIDDTRFKNELKFIINELKGYCFFILRPTNTEISNHSSEIELNWWDFEYNNLIFNDIDIKTLNNDWKYRLDRLTNDYYDYSYFHNEEIYLNCNQYAFIVPDNLNIKYAEMLANNSEFIANNNKMYIKFKSKNIVDVINLNSIIGGNNDIKNELDYYSLTFNNIFIIENLKKWNIFSKI